MDKHKMVYREEAFELLVDLETALLELEESPEDEELIGRVFRSLHTIKGSGAMFGYEDVAAFAHEIEAVFERVRDGKLPVAKDLVSLSLSACDLIRKMVAEEKLDTTHAAEMMGRFREMLPDRPAGDEPEAAAVLRPFQLATYRIRFHPHAELFATGANPALIIDEVREMGECEVVAHVADVPPLDRLDPEACYLRWDLVLRTDRGENAIEDAFIFVADSCDLDIQAMDAGAGPEGEPADFRRIGEILLERGDITPDALDEALSAQARERFQDRGAEKRIADMGAASSIRVPADKLDTLVNLVGELVTVQANLSRKGRMSDDPELLAISEEVERLITSLRENAMSLRMLPIGSTFQKFRRLVRDLGDELGKEVAMTTAGAETELDKTVIDQLNDPLVHIIRNEIDHGIEAPHVREALGKPRQGTIHMSAEHSGAKVLIRISGDGAGLDTDAIRAKAVERNLIPADMELDEDELHQLIFSAGFSTAARVTDVSGRGVGMDVVKRRIEALHGAVEIASRRGAGTAITLSLPLTLAIIDGLLVRIGATHFVLPLSAVEECLEMSREEANRCRDRGMMRYRERMVIYQSLRTFFNVDGDPPDIERVVVSDIGGEKIGFGLDQVIGHHQTVIKPLGRIYRDIEGVSGATILGDGSVSLILDVHRIFQSMEGRKTEG
jgi:two-component system, chemotaxis family, sensor kinase CheA